MYLVIDPNSNCNVMKDSKETKHSHYIVRATVHIGGKKHIKKHVNK